MAGDSRLAFYFLYDAFNVGNVRAFNPIAQGHAGTTLTTALLTPGAAWMILTRPNPDRDRQRN